MLHIGDIHFKHIDKNYSGIVNRDRLFPQKLSKALSINGCKSIIDSLSEEMRANPLVILVSGDLCAKGDIDDFKDCLEFLKLRIPPNFFSSNPFQKIFLVPGNHDIDRKEYSEDSILPKFQPMMDALKEKEFPEMPLDTIKTEEIFAEKSGEALIIAINSCYGCGERRLYPKEIRDAIGELLDADPYSKDFEDLDTPMFNAENIDTLASLIRSTNINCVPIILSHHNLLTQNTPKVELYSELINGGYMRDVLISLNRPILYLHGHLHDDPIEVISSPNHENSKIICVSAPLLFPNTEIKSRNFGFNKIKIFYSHNMTPIGCEIVNNRFADLSPEKRKVRIRFWDLPKTMALMTEKQKELLELMDRGTNLFLTDLKDISDRETGQNSSLEEIEKLVEELEWLGLVEYNRGSETNPLGMRKVCKVVL